MSGTFIFPFDRPAGLEIVGGKGLNLIRLSRAGMPVPPGFVVSTDAYTAFVRYNHLDELLASTLSTYEKGASLSETSEQIRTGFACGEFPNDLEQAISTAYQNLCQQTGGLDLPVAVRSSATAEDLADASFAGQQDTYLNMHGEAAVLVAVRRCFGSLWSERAIDYRAHQSREQGLAPLDARLAVVVQQMVFADAAGVLFTANPLNGDRNQMVIDAAFGLGEALVSGLVTPDHILIDKRSGRVLSYTLAKKTAMVVSTAEGTQEQAVPRDMQHRRVLRQAQLRALFALGKSVEDHYGRPQDVEWCLSAGQLYLVQARPITTLPDRPVSWDAPGPGQWLHGGGTFEMITEPISPLFETFLLPIFVDTIIWMLTDFGLKGMLPTVPYRVVNGFLYLHMDLHLHLGDMAGLLRDWNTHMHSLEQQETEQALYRQAVAERSQVAPAELTGEEIIARMQALGLAAMRYWFHITEIAQVIYRRERAFTTFYRQSVRRADDPEPEIFLRGQQIMPWKADCSTYELAQLAQRYPSVAEVLKTDPESASSALAGSPAGQEFLSALAAHLERYGHQLSSFDLLLPTLADDPRPVLTAVQAFLNGKESPYERQQRMTEERDQAIARVTTRLTEKNRVKFQQLLEAALEAAQVREDALFDVGLAWTHMHRGALELGRRLAGAGVLEKPEDIFWLTLAEIQQSIHNPAEQTLLKSKVTERQASHAAWSQVDAPYLLPVGSKPAFWWHLIFPTPELQHHPDAHTLIGLGVSPGKITAVARVIHSLAEMNQLNPGEILVARTTTPAWTPLFARAAGLVTDLGGPLAHGSIVAREYGIPAVMGTGAATQRIRSGQVITLYGSEGKVVLA